MFNIESTEFYEDDSFEMFMKKEDFDFYKEKIEELLPKLHDVSIVWIVPDEDEGHLEAKCFKTWDDAHTWINQK